MRGFNQNRRDWIVTSPSNPCAIRALAATFSMFAGVCLLEGCTDAPPRQTPEPEVSRAPDYGRGARVYQRNCSSCHDGGHRDAPTLDDIEAWDERSFQWDALLRQHVAQGFLSMPPEGGHPELSETSMNDVLFFMETKIRALDE